ncbi:hypothetical protein N7L96_01480 [Mammaliicoccus sciuri]|uniref:hypothetical protein n=1 Tax=Mammaliicoccus sciuri TaxID=1296 RepID=UPI001950AF4A|nr:hypothetical protein [Mammaliicoccus sciuri]MCJ0919858.1 hypothetical protein [Mammaliicoccus sciuri]MCJ0962701.1 hypothetical protein [Mammaliicoccus sciuri]MCJ1776503.1 hypothetical protein [Mammaliicoccus sciuri]MDC5693258.1 hypothetical protein [Mammaliicoccus sciuri]
MNIFKKIKLFFVNEKSFLGFIAVSLVLVIIGSIGYNLYKSGETLLDESVVSLAAFTMLIYTSYLQNKDLKLTRKELEMTREELKGTKEVQEEQKNQMIQSNEMMKETIIQSRYFELLKIKEETYSIIDVEDKKSNLNLYITKYRQACIEEIINNLSKETKLYISDNLQNETIMIVPNMNKKIDSLKTLTPFKFKEQIKKVPDNEFIFEEMEKVYLEKEVAKKPTLTRNQEKLFKTHKTIKNLIYYLDDNNRPKGFWNKNRDQILATLNKFSENSRLISGANPKVKDEYTLYELYKSTLLEEEEVFYKCVEDKLEFDELIG